MADVGRTFRHNLLNRLQAVSGAYELETFEMTIGFLDEMRETIDKFEKEVLGKIEEQVKKRAKHSHIVDTRRKIHELQDKRTSGEG